MSTDYGRWTDKPIRYPENEASSIYDAGAFRIGDRATVHRPRRYRFRDGYGHMVTAHCGTYGHDYHVRPVSWAGVWGNADECRGCWS